MTVKVLSRNSAVVYQTYDEQETELMGEPAIIVQEYESSGLICLSQEDNEIRINYDTIAPLIKVFKTILAIENLFDKKF